MFALSKKDVYYLILLITISAIVRIPLILLNDNACLSDECLYAKILDEMIRKNSIITTYFGEYVPWKPPLTFYVYSLFYFLSTFIEIEKTFRIPSALFGVLSTITLYFFIVKLLKNENKRQEIAFYASIAFSLNPAFLITNSLFLVDNLLTFLVFLSLIFYLDGEKNPQYFLVAGIFSSLAFLTKTIMALTIYYLAFFYYFFKNRRMLLKKEFIISLLFIPATFSLMVLFFGSPFLEQFFIDTKRISLPNIDGLYSLLMFISLTIPFIIFSFIWMYKKIKDRKLDWELKFYISWLLLIYPATFSYQLLYWYFIPLLPPVMIMGIKEMSKKYFDSAFVIVFFLLMIIILPISYLPILTIDEGYMSQKIIGSYLINKSNILLITAYSPGIIYYKFYFENKDYSKDFVLLFTNDFMDDHLENIITKKMKKENFYDYLKAVYGLYEGKKVLFYGNYLNNEFDYIVIDERVFGNKFEMENILKKYNYSLEKKAGIYSIYRRER